MNAFNGLLGRAQVASLGIAQARYGIVDDYDVSTHSVRLSWMIDPTIDPIPSNYLKIATAGVGGPGLSVRYVPVQGQLAYAVPDLGSVDNYVVIGFVHNSIDTPAQITDSIGGAQRWPNQGEFSICAEGVEFLITSGKVFIKGAVEIDGPLTVSKLITGQQDIVADGQVKDFHNTLDNLRQAHNTHVHSGVQGGPTNTAPPTSQD